MQDAFVCFEAHLEAKIDKTINSIIAYRKLQIDTATKASLYLNAKSRSKKLIVIGVTAETMTEEENNHISHQCIRCLYLKILEEPLLHQ